MAGATSPQWQTEADMIKAIRETGLTPVQRDTFYEPIKILKKVSGTEAMAHSAPQKNAVQ
jgi:2-iminoacetate synthase ThiH